MKSKNLYQSAAPVIAGTVLYFLLMSGWNFLSGLTAFHPAVSLAAKVLRLGLPCGLMYRMGVRMPPVARRPVFSDLSVAGLCLCGMIAVRYPVQWLSTVLPASEVSADIRSVWFWISACILSPILEECFFRGMLLTGLTPFGNAAACVACSVIFALPHSGALSIFYAFLCGMILSFCAMRTQKLMWCMLLHFAANLTALCANLQNASLAAWRICDAILLIGGLLIFILFRGRAEKE